MNPLEFLEFGLADAIDILLIALALFFLYRRMKGTLAIQAIAGLIFIILVNVLVSLLGLTTLNFILEGMLDLGALAIIILFAPDIRRLLTDIGKNPALDRFFGKKGSADPLDEIISAVREMSQNRIGAILVFPKTATLQDLNDPGKEIDAKLTKEMLLTVFQKESVFHDGAAIIRNNRIESVRVTLPISKQGIDPKYGTRHRAGLGVTESNKALAVIVSEETGNIAIARDGTLEGKLTIQTLRARLTEYLLEEKPKVTKL